MKRNLIIGAAIAVTGIVSYLLFKNKGNKAENTIVKKSHHLTDVFSKAKEVAVNG
jgi:hypothetical protein